MKHAFVLPALGLLALLPGAAPTQIRVRADQPDMTVTETLRNETIDTVLRHLVDGYVFPEIGKKMEAAVREKEKNGDYKSVTSAKDLAAKLTQDLQAVCKDRHLRVVYSHDPIQTGPTEPTAEERRRRERMIRAGNNGFEKIERLEGNIGYLKFNSFVQPDQGAETVTAAMNFLANTDALIVDLRQNGGGSAAMVVYMCSYFFPAEPMVHLNSIYFREDDSTKQFWSMPTLPGKRYLDKPVYVLTSSYTFSGAEEYSYNLQTQKRATIVGQTTGGGAHPVRLRPANAHFAVSVPFARSINPVTKTNWEGTGIKPDIATSEEDALKVAHTDALKKLIANSEEDGQRKDLQRALDAVEQRAQK